MDLSDEHANVLNETEEENQVNCKEPNIANEEEGGDATEVPERADEITLDDLSDGTKEIIKTANKFTPELHRDLNYYIDAESDSLKESDFSHFTKLASQFDAAEFYTTNCAIAASTLYRIKFGNILCKLKELHKKHGKGNWEDFADEHFEISKETRTLYMRISRIKRVNNYAFLGVERLREVASVIKKLEIDDEDQIAALFKRFSATLDIDLSIKDLKETLDGILAKASMDTDKGFTLPANGNGDNTKPQVDGNSPDTPPPSSENVALIPGNNENKKVLNQESLNRGIYKLIESVDDFISLEIGEDVVSVEIIDDFQSKLTELREKLEILKEKITNI